MDSHSSSFLPKHIANGKLRSTARRGLGTPLRNPRLFWQKPSMAITSVMDCSSNPVRKLCLWGGRRIAGGWSPIRQLPFCQHRRNQCQSHRRGTNREQPIGFLSEGPWGRNRNCFNFENSASFGCFDRIRPYFVTEEHLPRGLLSQELPMIVRFKLGDHLQPEV
jgi:hypothetical protein